MNPIGENHPDGSETRLRDYLEELRDEPPEPEPPMSARIVRTARWQHAARGPLQAIGMLLDAVAAGIAELFGDRRPR